MRVLLCTYIYIYIYIYSMYVSCVLLQLITLSLTIPIFSYTVAVDDYLTKVAGVPTANQKKEDAVSLKRSRNQSLGMFLVEKLFLYTLYLK